MSKQKQAKVGKFIGIPYDWRKPTLERLKSRLWNPNAPLVSGRWYGWGYDFNMYALLHPFKWRANLKAISTNSIKRQ